MLTLVGNRAIRFVVIDSLVRIDFYRTIQKDHFLVISYAYLSLWFGFLKILIFDRFRALTLQTSLYFYI